MNRMYRLKYFLKSDYICGSDFENEEKEGLINLEQVSSVSNIEKFYLPLSGSYKGEYAIVSMQNRDRYYINNISLEGITEALLKGVKEDTKD